MLPLLLLLLAAPARAADAVRILNLNTLNCDPILNGEPKAKFLARMRRQLAAVKRLDPALALMQEVTGCRFDDMRYFHTADLIARETGLKKHWWRSEGSRAVWDEGIAFFWDPERVTLSDIRCRHLKHTRRKAVMRIVKSLCSAHARFADGRELRVYHTHLDVALKHSSPQVDEILEVLGWETGPDTPVLLSGDFNNRPGTPAMERIRAADFTAAAQDDVDWMWTRSMPGTVRGRTVDFKSDGASDHNGLVLDWSPAAP